MQSFLVRRGGEPILGGLMAPPREYNDPETNLRVPASVGVVRAAYRSTVDEVIEEWRDLLAATGVSYEVVLTDQSFGVPLRRAFAAREQLP